MPKKLQTYYRNGWTINFNKKKFLQVLKHICFENQLISCVKEEKEEEEKQYIYIYTLNISKTHPLEKYILLVPQKNNKFDSFRNTVFGL